MVGHDDESLAHGGAAAVVVEAEAEAEAGAHGVGMMQHEGRAQHGSCPLAFASDRDGLRVHMGRALGGPSGDGGRDGE